MKILLFSTLPNLYKILLIYIYIKLNSSYHPSTGILRLPELRIDATSHYLFKEVLPITLECNLYSANKYSPSYKLDDPIIWPVFWFKDGFRVEKKDGYYAYDGKLNITNLKLKEGNYQCAGHVENIKLNVGYVGTDLVSPPLKLIRTRTSKFFYKTKKKTLIHCFQRSNTRIPCEGLPHIVPNPYLLWFEKDDNPRIKYGIPPYNKRHVATQSGLQIYNVSISDGGKYSCKVKNLYTNQTRKNYKPVILKVNPGIQPEYTITKKYEDYAERKYMEPKYIKIHTSINSSILLECYLLGLETRWIWEKHGSLPPETEMIGSNLKFKRIIEKYSGNYTCESINPGVTEKVYYSIIVHKPSFVSFDISSISNGNMWIFHCLSRNLIYEVPLMYLESVDLSQTMTRNKKYIPLFYSNPITFNGTTEEFKGSIQCMSRPSMEEGEVYGQNLNVGKTINYLLVPKNIRNYPLSIYNVNQTRYTGESVEIYCYTGGDRYTFTFNGESLSNLRNHFGGRDKWNREYTIITNLNEKDQGWYSCRTRSFSTRFEKVNRFYLTVYDISQRKIHMEINKRLKLREEQQLFFETYLKTSYLEVPFIDYDFDDIRLFWDINTINENIIQNFTSIAILTKSFGERSKWEVDCVVPINETSVILNRKNGIFKIKMQAIKNDRSLLNSPESKWINFGDSPNEYLYSRKNIMYGLTYFGVKPINDSEIQLVWIFTDNYIIGDNLKHQLMYQKLDNIPKDYKSTLQEDYFESNSTQLILGNLLSNTTYRIRLIIFTEFVDIISPEIKIKTNITIVNGKPKLCLSCEVKKIVIKYNIHIFLPLFFATVFLCGFFCQFPYCEYLTCRFLIRIILRQTPTGKFMDTSAYIYNQQNIEKSKVYHEVMRNALNDVNIKGLSINTISNFTDDDISTDHEENNIVDNSSSDEGTLIPMKEEEIIIEKADTESSPINYLSIDGRDTLSESWYSGERNTINYQEIFNEPEDIISLSNNSEFPNYTNIENINNPNGNNYANIGKFSDNNGNDSNF
ncbi:Immunoglobulin subtype domain and Immunoglobulin-like domain and Immunoglobulin-like fold domain-containing protein [Strongyloides ratti]|uniref:Immunoglobulin subtype domain and Immunoglobulin-like domain and Immunoglobulin-like fold domain-containing protein n=1 Tax=Strongyloides ratti TaxID=34506 RepID=A0A090KPM3_STRRB|nr:Immunoglobulin subtype domain and Immunoglobulin-like domain and Immunoglobulin-like fold domain-containing protein [Strongyloides ratti]CEF59523.1 Immunoglobulin subtype domain and Immunoglobulin-like domain and Immunoglobulin-like fold domain-containing protein [Strongyloides ratti]